MIIPPKYTLTPEITASLQAIEVCKAVIDSFPLPIEIETNIRRQSILKSALFSARIEGGGENEKKREVYNILRAIEQSHSKNGNISMQQILQIHETVMQGLIENPGVIRNQASAIFNTAGVAVYMPPSPQQIIPLLERLILFANNTDESFVPIRAVLCHYVFEKIHPFLDGNGRVGRVLLQTILENRGFGMKGLLTIEEYIDTHKSLYYQGLENSENDVTEYVTFMLSAIVNAANNTKEQIIQKHDASPEEYLLPRRAEILAIIKDHEVVNFDFIRRRFLAVNERSLRFDLQQLQKKGFIRKLGTTKGVYYEAKR